MGWPAVLGGLLVVAALLPGSGAPARGLASDLGAVIPAAPSAAPAPLEDVNIVVNGMPLGPQGAVEEGVALVPADTVVAALGGSVVQLRTPAGVRIGLGGTVLTASAYSAEVQVNGRSEPLPVPAALIGGRLYLPVEALASLAGYSVNWPTPSGAIVIDRGAPMLNRLTPPLAASDQAPNSLAASVAPPVPPPAAPASVIPYTPSDLNLMARVVHGEADGQPTEAKVGVAAVIVNRVRDPGWPKTIAGVIYAPGQFQAVGYPLFEQGPSAADVQAALSALRGDDPTGGAVFFYNPATTWSGSWMFTRRTLVTIGAFRFAD